MLSPQYRPIVGGYERAAERLSAALTAHGHCVTVIAERRDKMWPAMETIDGVRVRRLWCVYRVRFHTLTALCSFGLFLLTQGRRFDIWHVHQYGYHAALAVAVGKLLRRPVVLKLTSSAATGIDKVVGRGTGGRIRCFLHRHVSACLAVSEETREEAIRFGVPSDRIHLIPNGVDGRQFRPDSSGERNAARRALGLDCERLVLSVGRLSSEKNPLGLLDAWQAINTKTRQGALLALVGDGPDWDEVHARAQMPNLRASVYLAGRRSDVETWYRATDVYVIQSQVEGLSNTMIEALASGLPIISTRVSGSSILLEPPTAGLVVDVGDVRQLARAMEFLLQNASIRTRLGVNARRRFESRFSLETVSKKMISLYEELLRGNQKRARA